MVHHEGISKELLRVSFIDLQQDFDERLWLISDVGYRLDGLVLQIRKCISKYYPQLSDEIITAIHLLLGDIDNIKRDCITWKTQCGVASTSSDLTLITSRKHELTARIRAVFSRSAGIFVAADWQSPTFLHSVNPQAGVQLGRIMHTINDYKRDIHYDAQQFEDAFKREFIDGMLKLPINVYATSSGMSAINTIMNYLAGERLAEGNILVGKRTYFEAKDLLHTVFREHVIEFDELDISTFIHLLREWQPTVLWLDSLTNTEDIVIPNIPDILDKTAQYGKNPTTVVLDNTGLSVTYQPLRQAFIKPKNVNLIVTESLNKYYQYGLDRTTGGVLWAVGGDTGKISEYRVHTGTNIPDICVYMLPTPNRKRLLQRLDRLERNAVYLATQLDTVIRATGRADAVEVIYPGLTGDTADDWTKNIPFHGSCLTLKFKDPYRRVSFYKQFVEKVVRRAKSEHVPLVSGSSFGLDITRIYLTAIRASAGVPFVRIAVGTEHQADIHRIAKVCGDVITMTSA